MDLEEMGAPRTWISERGFLTGEIAGEIVRCWESRKEVMVKEWTGRSKIQSRAKQECHSWLSSQGGLFSKLPR